MQSKFGSLTIAACSLLLAGLLAGAVLAQGSGAGSGSGSGEGARGSGSGSGAAAATPAEMSPSSKAYTAANEKMHKTMAITMTGNADIDFVNGMIPHHQGAVEMAKIVLEHGKDAEVRKLAQDVIKAQETEIAWMTEWLKKRAK